MKQIDEMSDQPQGIFPNMEALSIIIFSCNVRLIKHAILKKLAKILL